MFDANIVPQMWIYSYIATSILDLSETQQYYVHSSLTAIFIHPQENGKIILMLDGTFGCVRKFSSGKSHEMAKHKNRFFLNESAVDLFVNEHSAAVKENKKVVDYCKDFLISFILRHLML